MAHGTSRGARPARPGAPFGALTVALAACLLLTGCGDQGPFSADPDVPPTPPAQPPATSGTAEPAPEHSPDVIDPVEGRRERQVSWRLVREAEGPSVVVEVQAGGPPCDVVTGIEVDESPDRIALTVWAGREPGATCAGYPALLGTFHVRVPLEAPLGARVMEHGSP